MLGLIGPNFYKNKKGITYTSDMYLDSSLNAEKIRLLRLEL
jgi:hypothetical protein